MSEATVGVRELRQNLSRYLDRVKAGEGLVVTEHGRVVARLVPAGAAAHGYEELVETLGVSVPSEPLEAIIARLTPRALPDGTTDALLAADRRDRSGSG